MENYKVTKRNGQIENFDVMKIKKVIQAATLGLDVNPLELESQVQLVFKGEMTSREIHKNLIGTALRLTNISTNSNMQWRFVAARLLLMDLFKDAAINRKLKKPGYGNYYQFVVKATEEGLYDRRILDNYTKAEIEEVAKELDFRYDYGYDYAGMNLLGSRYLIQRNGKPFELPQEMYLSVALLLAMGQKDKVAKAKEYYHVTASRKVSLATPIILNLRRPGGSLSSCNITALSDDLNGIYYGLEQMAQISKNGGGIGVNVSRIRSLGAQVKKIKGASGGVIPWIKLINDTAVAVNQTGSRSGAITVALDVWHKDIEDFLDMQTENGDQRRKCYDIFPQIVIPDIFMERVEKNGDWTLIDPKEVKDKYQVDLAELWGDEFQKVYLEVEKDTSLELSKKIKARELFIRIAHTVVETGMPYVVFKDNMNQGNPNKHSGMIGNGNLCMESFANFSPSKVEDRVHQGDKVQLSYEQKSESGLTHCCNLVSLNLAVIRDEELRECVRLSVEILDNTVDLSFPPTPESKKHNELYRILGIGSTGLNDWIVAKGKNYVNSKEIVKELFEKIAFYGIERSTELALERGKYHFFEGSDWSKGILFGKKDAKWFEENPTSLGKDAWVELIEKVKRDGMRNGSLFAIAPNTSTSLLLGCTSSILPIYGKFFYDKASKGTVPIIPPNLTQATFFHYIENRYIDQKEVVEMVANIQEWTDQGVSMELIFNLNMGLTAKDIKNLYFLAHKRKLKTVYYIRSIALSVERDKEECLSCAN